MSRYLFIGGPVDGAIREVSEHADRRGMYLMPVPQPNMFEPNPMRLVNSEIQAVAYYPHVIANRVGQQITVYVVTGTRTDRLNDFYSYSRDAAIECYGAEFFEEWHPVTFATFSRAGARGLHRGLINDSHTMFAIEHDRIRGPDLSRQNCDLVITLGSEHVRYSTTPRWTNGGKGSKSHTIFDLHPEVPKMKVKTYRDHPEYRAFIRAICASPADDLPRLVFADWLDEHDEAELAEFIRLQIEYEQLLATMPEPPCKENVRAYEINKITKKYLIHLQDETVKELGRWALQGIEWKWSRGFISAVRLTLAQFEEHAARIAAEHPIAEDGWVLTDAEPLHEALPLLSSKPYWYWPWISTGRCVSSELWVSEHISYNNKRESMAKHFPTREAAMQALSRAAYVVARKRAEAFPFTRG